MHVTEESIMFIKRDPGPCPVDDAPHTTCVAPHSGGVIVAGPTQTPTSITVPTPTVGEESPVVNQSTGRDGEKSPMSPPPDPTFTTKNFRGRGKRER
jgi:hypothetical protein